MFCAVDIGNTNVVLAIHNGKRWVHSFRAYTDQKKTGDEYFVILDSLIKHAGLRSEDVDQAALSSVVPNLTRSLEKNVYRLFGVHPLVVTHEVRTNLKDIPSELGSDLLCNMVSGHAKKPDMPVMVCDFGTALTMSTVGKDGNILGVAITPGLITATNALFSNTAQLPQVELKIPESALGKNTQESIRSGIMFGYAGLVESMVKRTEKELGEKLYVIATGGLSRMISPLIPSIDELNPYQTLDGLLMISGLNR